MLYRKWINPMSRVPLMKKLKTIKRKQKRKNLRKQRMNNLK
jgi:hypothetical protein